MLVFPLLQDELGTKNFASSTGDNLVALPPGAAVATCSAPFLFTNTATTTSSHELACPKKMLIFPLLQDELETEIFASSTGDNLVDLSLGAAVATHSAPSLVINTATTT
ncbi:hypothetical protein ACA910_019178 [Epithemia clementina (nom. ined.)]